MTSINILVNAVVVDPSTPGTLYVCAVGDGVLKSTNSGANWTQSLFGTVVHALVIDPVAPATLYAGTWEGGLKSTNGGQSWEWMLDGLTAPAVNALVIDPSAPSTVYAGTYEGGVFKSTNAGASWTAINNGLTSTPAYTLAVDPSSEGTLYAGTFEGGVLKKTDATGSWTPVNNGLTHLTVNALAIDPSTPTTLYAGTDGGGVFKTTNAGESWRAINNGLTRPFANVAVDPLAPATVYAGTDDGLFKSTNGGESWMPASAGLTHTFVISMAVDPSTPGTVYAGTDGGLFKSTNGGASWTESLPGSDVWAVAIDPSAPSTLYVAMTPPYQHGRILKSSDGGATWTVSFDGPFFDALAIDPQAPTTVYAGTAGAGVFKSTNGGATWTPMNAGLTAPYLNGLAIDPSNPARIYAATDGGVYEYEQAAEPCISGATTLCLNGGRFRVTTEWSTPSGQSGAGQAVELTEDTGYFTFFDSANAEVLVKVLDGCGFNSRFWAFAGGLTDVHVVMTVLDSQTGDVKTYTNPQGTAFQPVQDTDAFATCGSGIAEASMSVPQAPSIASGSSSASETCVANATTLCLNNARYKVQAQWLTRDGASGAGQVINLTGDTGAFWFFSPSNVEVVVKVLNGCGFNSRYWTFAGGLTDVDVILTVTDTQSGAIRTYRNAQGTPFQPIQDTNAFATCP